MVDKGLRRVSTSASLLSVVGSALADTGSLANGLCPLDTHLPELHTNCRKGLGLVSASAVWRHCIGCEWVTCLSLSLSRCAEECSVLIGSGPVPVIQRCSCWGWDPAESNHVEGWSGYSEGNQPGVAPGGDVSQSNSPDRQDQVQT